MFKSLISITGGSCIDGIDSYSCACPTGFTGQHCEISDQECVGENPCQNNGTCQKNGDGFICRCKPGFIGAICSSQVNECLTMPCANGGKKKSLDIITKLI